MLHALHRAGHRYLKLLFVLALAGSSAMFFIGAALPKPPSFVVVIVGAILGIALEWAYFTVSCDLTESISERSKGGIARDLLYTVIGGAASWFLFANAALHVGWAPADDLLGLSRQAWAMILAALIVLVIFALSARRARPESQADLQAIARAVAILLPDAPDSVRLRLLSAIAAEAAKAQAPGLDASLPSALPAPEAAPRSLPLSLPIIAQNGHQSAEREGASNGNTSF